MKDGDPTRALGSCASVVYRTWAFLHSLPVEQFATDDGVTYWFDRQTGETLWERPLAKEETLRIMAGGTKVEEDGEYPFVGAGAPQGYKPR